MSACPRAENDGPYRVAYLVSHPIQYQAPMLRYLARRRELDLTVFFLSDLSVRGYRDQGFGVAVKWDVPLLEGYRNVFLPSLGRRDRVTFLEPLVVGIRNALQAGHFDALWVHGYAHQAMLRAVAAAKSLGLPVLLRGESNLLGPAPRALRGPLRRHLLPRLFRRIDGFLAIGSGNRAFYRAYGVPEERIFLMPYAVDNEFFASRAAEARRSRESLRVELGLEAARPIILYAAKFLRRKRPADLLEAYRRLSPNGRDEPRPYLLYIGEGEERSRLEGVAQRIGWSSIRFLGFKNQTELPRYYDLADVFALPSDYEPWGLVVNEVMNAATPVIVTDRVGAALDLVEEGESGFVVPAGDVASLADRLRRLTESPELARRVGGAGCRRISQWNFEADARGLLGCLRSVVPRAGGPRRSAPGPASAQVAP